MNDDVKSHGQVPSRDGMAPRPASLRLKAGQQVGRFTLLEFLGEGGMGSVFAAEDPTRKDETRDGRVVLKFLRDDIRRCPEAVEQFRGAYRKVQQLFHEHICPLLDLGDDPTFGAFQVMPFVKGMTLLELLKKEDPGKLGLSRERVVSILQPVAKALDYSHREGLVHRDIKPGNIVVDPKTGKVFVVDFGLAAEVRTSVSQHSRSVMQVSGTEPYMAPEQWRGQAQDGRSDQYSLAVVAWQMLTGHLPFQGSGMQLGFAVTQGPIPELPRTLQQLQPVLAQALAQDRKQRFTSLVTFIDALSGIDVKVTELLQLQSNREDKQRLMAQLPKEPQPALLVAPFDAKQAHAAQEAWAKRLGIGVEVTNHIGMKFRVIPPGTFEMGSPKSEHPTYIRNPNTGEEIRLEPAPEPLHVVTIPQPQLFGVYPVTQAEWTKVMGRNPSGSKSDSSQDTARFPVEQVSWDDCQAYLEKLNAEHELKGWHYRLPTEAEWEYACRAGTVTPFWLGEELNYDQARFEFKEYMYGPSDVGEYGANPFGLYDQHGQVWEWCEDWFVEFGVAKTHRPIGTSSGSSRVLRGGSWCDSDYSCRSACRLNHVPSHRCSSIGFRVLCELV